MANNPYVNKVVFGDEVLIDTSEVTVDETSLEKGKTALNAAGATITGTREFVSGVKGDKESTYRTGNVNLTPANIGAFGLDSLPSTVTDVDNTRLYGSRMLNANNVSNMPPVGSGSAYFAVACMGSLQIAAQYGSNNGISALYARQYINSRWYPWTLLAENLSIKNMAQYIRLTGTDWTTLYATLSGLASGEISPMYASGAAMGVLTGGKVSNAVYGTVMRATNAGVYTFTAATAGSGQYTYSWRIDGLTSATDTPTIGTVYRYQGTAM